MKAKLLAAIAGGTLMLAGGALPACSAEPEATSHTKLTLSAYGETKVTPDMATVQLAVVTEDPNAAEAMRRNKARVLAAIDALHKAGVPDKAIRTTGLNLLPQFSYLQGRPEPVLRAYQAADQLSVTVDDISRLGVVIDAGVGPDGNRVNAVTLGVHDRQRAEDAARVAAIKALEEKAKVYQDATGRRITALTSLVEAAAPSAFFDNLGVSERNFHGRGEDLRDRISAGSVGQPISPGQLTLRVDVEGVYELN